MDPCRISVRQGSCCIFYFHFTPVFANVEILENTVFFCEIIRIFRKLKPMNLIST